MYNVLKIGQRRKASGVTMRLLFPLITYFLATGGATVRRTTESLTTTMARTATNEPACPPGWVNAHDEGCFTFLGEETNLTWIEGMLVCEQVELLSSILPRQAVTWPSQRPSSRWSCWPALLQWRSRCSGWPAGG